LCHCRVGLTATARVFTTLFVMTQAVCSNAAGIGVLGGKARLII